MISSAVCDRFSSLFGEGCVMRVMNVSDCLSVLRKCVSRRKDSLRNVFLIIIHFLMIILSVLLLISLIPKHSVVIMKPSTGGFRQINARFRICLWNLWFPSIGIHISVRIINHTLHSWISFLRMHKAHSFPLAMKIIRRLQELWLPLVKSIRVVYRSFKRLKVIHRVSAKPLISHRVGVRWNSVCRVNHVVVAFLIHIIVSIEFQVRPQVRTARCHRRNPLVRVPLWSSIVHRSSFPELFLLS